MQLIVIFFFQKEAIVTDPGFTCDVWGERGSNGSDGLQLSAIYLNTSVTYNTTPAAIHGLYSPIRGAGVCTGVTLEKKDTPPTFDFASGSDNTRFNL